MSKSAQFFRMFMYFGVIPLVVSLINLGTVSLNLGGFLASTIVTLGAGGIVAGIYISMKLKAEINKVFPLLLLPLVYTTVLWSIFMLISGGFFGADVWLFYVIAHIALSPVYFLASLIGEGRLYLWAPIVYEVSFIIALYITSLIMKFRPIVQLKKLILILTVLLLAIGTGELVKWQRSKTVLPTYGFSHGGGYSSTDLTPYEVTNPYNTLPELEEDATFKVTDFKEMPVLDGAEAAFPVYSAFANAVYENISLIQSEKKDVVSFTNTIYAFERLLAEEVDIYFGAEPSKEQRDMAQKLGKDLVMTPIGKEAFVFFVNPKNNINNLSISEIQGIYSGNIKNWSELGGSNEKIIAFQRPKNSGSQTLLEKIMGDTEIAKPLKEEVPRGMGGIIEQVADYRNYENSIGFSFRYFSTKMRGNSEIKLLAVNGVEPSPENIFTNQYPFTASLFAITLKDNQNTNIQPFLDWMVSSQGQEILKKIGYISNQ